MEQNHNSKRVAKNTLYLYLRTLLVMLISIYTSRIILDVLGIDNYGIYNVVGGFVSMFSVLSGTLTAASQRFLAFELGKNTPDVKTVFSTSVTIHLVLALCIFLLLEVLGIWFLNCKMNIPSERLYAANWVFQCSVLTFCISLISIPYSAAIIAYEKMSAFAYISIVDVVLKLLAVYALYLIKYDVLIVYAILMLLIATMQRFIYNIYCSKNIKDCCYSFTYDRTVFSQMLKFSGWNFIGSSAAVMNGHGINMIVNIFFGVSMNAARGIASQVEHATSAFVQNFMMALNPQLTKSYASGDYAYVNKLIVLGTKYCYYLNWIICLPIIINCDYILDIWLKDVPNKAVPFTKLALLFTLCQSLSQCLYTTMLATGNIKKYQIIVGTLSLCAFPAAYCFFKLGFSAEFGYISIIGFSLICLIARLFLLKGMVPLFSIRSFIQETILYVGLSSLISLFVVSILHNYICDTTTVGRLLTESVLICIICMITVFLFGISKSERNFLYTYIKKRRSLNEKKY